jgi:hypothetical protein
LQGPIRSALCSQRADERRYAKLLEVLRREVGQDRLVDLILAECCLILPEAQAPQPDHDVHMDGETETLIKLREDARVRQQHAATLRLFYETTVPQIKMIVSNWYTDELGNQARFIKACD